MGKKIAILGTATSSLGLAPFNNPEWEIWACPGIYGHKAFGDISNLSLLLEIHDAKGIEEAFNGYDIFNNANCPTLTREPIAGLKNTVVYPIEEIIAMFPRKYFTNTISYGIAYALYLKAIGMELDTIGIWGVDMAVTAEYGHQRPSCEYFIGLAEGMGVPVFLPDECDLCKSAMLYGFETEQTSELEAKYKARKAELVQRRAQLEAQVMAKTVLKDPKKFVCPHCGKEVQTNGEFDYSAMQMLMQEAHLKGCIDNMDYLMLQRVGLGL